MMELVFNELTCQPYANNDTDCYTRVEQFVKTYKAAELHKFKRIRFHQAFDQIFLKEGYTLMDFCNSNRNKTFTTALLSVYHYPFIDNDSEEEKKYIQNHFFLLKDGEKIIVHGLAAAYLYNTIGIGFRSETFWDALLFYLQIEGEKQEHADILSVSRPEHFIEQAFLDWKEQSGDVQLVESAISVPEKSISLRNDHGKDVLQRFAEQLVCSPYVISVVNSLPYNPHEAKFIRKINANGLVEIVLRDTDAGLGLAVKTTGRTMRETREIATILEKEFK
jgi:hypothetical protein